MVDKLIANPGWLLFYARKQITMTALFKNNVHHFNAFSLCHANLTFIQWRLIIMTVLSYENTFSGTCLKENRQLNVIFMATGTFTSHQGADEPILLQVSVQECGVLIRKEQDPAVLQSGYSRRQHRAAQGLYGGWTYHSSCWRGFLSAGNLLPLSAVPAVVLCYT